VNIIDAIGGLTKHRIRRDDWSSTGKNALTVAFALHGLAEVIAGSAARRRWVFRRRAPAHPRIFQAGTNDVLASCRVDRASNSARASGIPPGFAKSNAFMSNSARAPGIPPQEPCNSERQDCMLQQARPPRKRKRLQQHLHVADDIAAREKVRHRRGSCSLEKSRLLVRNPPRCLSKGSAFATGTVTGGSI